MLRYAQHDKFLELNNPRNGEGCPIAGYPPSGMLREQAALRGGFDDQLRGVGTGLAACQADGGAAGCGEGKVIGTVACDVGCYVDADPHTRGHRTGRTQRSTKRRRVVVVDR